MPTPIVIDLSHHNVVPKNFHDTKHAGIRGVIHKATESAGFKDSKLASRYHLAKEAGLLWGVYHFLRPVPINIQIDHFLETSKNYSDSETLYALDHEDANVSLEKACEFLEAVEAEIGRMPVLYSGHVLKEQLQGQVATERVTRYRLWLAQYGPKIVLPNGFDRWWLWQYTDKGTIAGVTPPTDLNAFGGVDIAREWSGRIGPIIEPNDNPDPVTPATDKEVKISIRAPDGIKIVTEILPK